MCEVGGGVCVRWELVCEVVCVWLEVVVCEAGGGGGV